MQCPDCGYISFKQEKNCGSCGFNFKKAATSPASLFRNDSFTIFSSPKASEEEQESLGVSTPQAGEGIAVIDPPEGSQENPELESGEFLLNLTAAKKGAPETTLKSDASEPSASEFIPMEFGTDSDINLEEMEVEGLGLGLEPLEEEQSTTTPETSKTETEETLLEISEEPEAGDLDLAPENSDNLELKIDELKISSSEEPEVSDSAPEEITLNISEDTPSIENIDLEEANEELEIPSSSQNSEQDIVEPVAPVLDLGNTEITLDLDEDLEPESPEPSPPPTQSDELEIKLEIDDSDGPLTINDEETPEVEIEDLGLELEDSDSPPDPEKP
jgi:hypothetical protein